MTVLGSIYKHTIGRVLPTTSSSSTVPFTPSKPISKKRKFDDEHNDDDDDDDEEGHTIYISRRRKRDEDEGNDSVITKRRRNDQDYFTPIVDGEEYESIAIEAPSMAEQTPQKPDRFLMPPPALDASRRKSRRMEEDESMLSLVDFEGASQLSVGTRANQPRTSDEFVNDYDMERARRHAAATTLPVNSGIWEQGEKDLFYHLSYRGFEPLLPRNWMTDFQTLPLSIYESEDDGQPPLIQVYKSNLEFRAIRALRELLELGKNMRDRVLADRSVRTETIIEKAMKRYFDWALSDAGIKLQTKNAADKRGTLPIHVIVKLRPNQGHAECLAELKAKMHHLRARHCSLRNVLASVEGGASGYPSPNSAGEGTWVADEANENSPVIYGFAIVSSLLLVWTLNSRVPAPVSMPRTRLQSSPQFGTDDGFLDDAESHGDAESDPRFYSEFDFSDPSKDVWHALVIAIAAMQIRREMMLAAERAGEEGLLEDLTTGFEHTSVVDVDEDDPDK